MMSQHEIHTDETKLIADTRSAEAAATAVVGAEVTTSAAPSPSTGGEGWRVQRSPSVRRGKRGGGGKAKKSPHGGKAKKAPRQKKASSATPTKEYQFTGQIKEASASRAELAFKGVVIAGLVELRRCDDVDRFQMNVQDPMATEPVGGAFPVTVFCEGEDSPVLVKRFMANVGRLLAEHNERVHVIPSAVAEVEPAVASLPMLQASGLTAEVKEVASSLYKGPKDSYRFKLQLLPELTTDRGNPFTGLAKSKCGKFSRESRGKVYVLDDETTTTSITIGGRKATLMKFREELLCQPVSFSMRGPWDRGAVVRASKIVAKPLQQGPKKRVTVDIDHADFRAGRDVEVCCKVWLGAVADFRTAFAATLQDVPSVPSKSGGGAARPSGPSKSGGRAARPEKKTTKYVRDTFPCTTMEDARTIYSAAVRVLLDAKKEGVSIRVYSKEGRDDSDGFKGKDGAIRVAFSCEEDHVAYFKKCVLEQVAKNEKVAAVRVEFAGSSVYEVPDSPWTKQILDKSTRNVSARYRFAGRACVYTHKETGEKREKLTTEEWKSREWQKDTLPYSRFQLLDTKTPEDEAKLIATIHEAFDTVLEEDASGKSVNVVSIAYCQGMAFEALKRRAEIEFRQEEKTTEHQMVKSIVPPWLQVRVIHKRRAGDRVEFVLTTDQGNKSAYLKKVRAELVKVYQEKHVPLAARRAFYHWLDKSIPRFQALELKKKENRLRLEAELRKKEERDALAAAAVTARLQQPMKGTLKTSKYEREDGVLRVEKRKPKHKVAKEVTPPAPTEPEDDTMSGSEDEVSGDEAAVASNPWAALLSAEPPRTPAKKAVEATAPVEPKKAPGKKRRSKGVKMSVQVGTKSHKSAY